MMTPKRLEEMRRAGEDVISDAPILKSNLWLAHALRDAIAEIEELQKSNRMLREMIGGATP